jgi:CHRD domain
MKVSFRAMLFVSAAFLFVQSSDAAVRTFVASITHDQEVSTPPVPNEGTSGTGVFILNDDNPAAPFMTYNVSLMGLDLDGNQTPGTNLDNVTNAHIHNAVFGQNGGVVFGQIAPNHDTNPNDLIVNAATGTISGKWDAGEGSTTLSALLTAGAFNPDANGRTSLYYNVHTTDHPGGEIRGQLTLIPEPASCMLCLIGIASFCTMRRRK